MVKRIKPETCLIIGMSKIMLAFETTKKFSITIKYMHDFDFQPNFSFMFVD